MNVLHRDHIITTVLFMDSLESIHGKMENVQILLTNFLKWTHIKRRFKMEYWTVK